MITKMLQEIQEKLWNHLGKILFMSIRDIKNVVNFRNKCPRYHSFSFVVSLVFRDCPIFREKFEYIFEKYFLWI